MRKIELVADIVESMSGEDRDAVLPMLFGRLSVDAKRGDKDAVEICKAIAGVLGYPHWLEEEGIE